MTYEVNYDGLVGPTHNYSGLSLGNIASMENKEAISHPKQAALQGLEKMKFLADLGIPQGFIPPQERPHLPSLRKIGFSGTDRQIPEKAFKVNPVYLYHYTSASSMWTANAATVTPSMDSFENKVQFTPANMASKTHRSIEAPMTSKFLKAIFPHPLYFTHHDPLPYSSLFNDEGAANHTRFCSDVSGPGVHLFVYGMRGLLSGPAPKNFPARQTREAQEALLRKHQLDSESVVFAQQSPIAIDAGVFHNDVISVGNHDLFFFHENAFIDTEGVIRSLTHKFQKICGREMRFIKVTENEVPVKTAVETYLFNSQLIKESDGAFTLVAPAECQSDPTVSYYLEKLFEDPESPIRDLHFLNLRESMRNGGGPACLRLRVPLTQKELEAANPYFFLNDTMHQKLTSWIEKHYRDELKPGDLADPHLVDETQAALNELTRILDLGSIYEFQQ